MRRLVVKPAARRDAAAILLQSRQQFGIAARQAYRRLIAQAYRELQAEPTRHGVKRLGDTHLYHLRHTRARLPANARPKMPRHIVAFRFDDAEVVILRILRDSMDIEARLSPETDET